MIEFGSALYRKKEQRFQTSLRQREKCRNPLSRGILPKERKRREQIGFYRVCQARKCRYPKQDQKTAPGDLSAEQPGNENRVGYCSGGKIPLYSWGLWENGECFSLCLQKTRFDA